jgi:hypothetical protein
VPIVFEPQANGGEAAVVGASDARGWSPGCLVSSGCLTAAAPLARCDPSLAAKEWRDVEPTADTLMGQVVHLRGPLGVGPMGSTLMGCPPSDGQGCCNRVGGPVVLGGASPLALAGFFCAGDESQACCNAPAYGQPVVATGRLMRNEASGPWTLVDAALCVE